MMNSGSSKMKIDVSKGKGGKKYMVGKVSELREKKKVLIEDIGGTGRSIAIFSVKGNFFAMDSKCYHTGGPLHLGDIEDINGKPCVICPWHSYKLNLLNGEGIYQAIDPPSGKTKWKSKGIKQRVHKTFIENGGDKVFVELNMEGSYESDQYFTEEYVRRMKQDVVDITFNFNS